MQPIITFTKPIKQQVISCKEIEDPRDIKKVGDVIAKLESMSGVRDSSLHELNIRSNAARWAATSLDSYPALTNRQEMEYLISDFTDSMQTRMREETKYALAVLMENRLLLCHSVYGEETITPEWKTIPRMLDTDNVLRFVAFYCQHGQLMVKYWEREATNSFTDWLGLSRKQIFLLGGKYKVRSEIADMSLEFQLDETEIERLLQEHPEISLGRIDLPHPIQSLTIKGIRSGREQYDNPKDFIQDYRAERFGMPRYQAEYRRLKASRLPLFVKFIDERDHVLRVEGDVQTIELEKNTPDFTIMLADGDIDLRASLLAELVGKILNREPQNIFHAGHEFNAAPYVIGETRIYNRIHWPPEIAMLASYYAATSLQDTKLNAIFLYAVCRLLAHANTGSPLGYLFGGISDDLIARFAFEGKLSKTEDGVLEYKSRDVLSGRPEVVAERLADDLKKKLSKNRCKLYLVGLEDDGTFKPVARSRMKSDRMEVVRSALAGFLPSVELHVLPVCADDEGLVLVVAQQRS